MTFVIYRDRKKEWRWRLVARNGNIIANSGEGYQRKSGALKSIHSIQAKAVHALVEIPN